MTLGAVFLGERLLGGSPLANTSQVRGLGLGISFSGGEGVTQGDRSWSIVGILMRLRAFSFESSMLCIDEGLRDCFWTSVPVTRCL